MRRQIDISVLIPTNLKRPEVFKKVIRSLSIQTIIKKVEIIVVSEVPKPDFLELQDEIKFVQTKKDNGIFLNFKTGLSHAKGNYLFLMDDDILLTEATTLEQLLIYLQKNPKVWAVGPFINEFKGTSTKITNRIYDSFKKFFRIWDPEDHTNKIYSCFGKGSANHPDKLPKEPYIGCQWLTNQSLLISKEVFQKYHDDDLEVFNKYHRIEKIWAVDFYLTHRLFLRNNRALAFYPMTSVDHLGVDSTSFNLPDRVFRETICGYYYYHRFLKHRSFVVNYILPCIGRFIYLFTRFWNKPKLLFSSLYLFFYSFVVLVDKRERLKGVPVYA